MKIVHIITRMILGGAQENTLFTCMGQHERGHDVTLITGPTEGPEGALIDRARRAGFSIVEVDELQREIAPINDWAAYKKLKKILTDLAPDIVHTHSAKAGILGRLAAGAVRKQCPSLSNMKIIHGVHGLPFHPYQAEWKNRLFVALERRAAADTDAFICVADAMTVQSLAQGIGRPDQYTRVFSGMDTQAFLAQVPAESIAAWRSELGIPADALVITTVARLAELKGHDMIIAAAAELAGQYQQVHWLFVGDGHLRDLVERQIESARLNDRIHLAGLVPPERVADLLHASDILLHCSLREGLARALPQALLSGIPAISYDLDGASEVVLDGRTGILIAPENICRLIDAQRQLIDDAALRQRLGRAGQEFCREEFPWHTMVDRIEAVYDAVRSA